MNAINDATIQALRAVIARASQDDNVRTLVLTGQGHAFCAGADLSGANPGSGGGASRFQRLDRRRGSAETVQGFADCDVPIIAAINGPTAGAGFGIACCVDIRFMAASARMGTIFAKRGIATDYGTA